MPIAENPEWQAQPYGPGAKHIELTGPSDGSYEQAVYLDFDDVNRTEIERRVPIILGALNAVDPSEWEPVEDSDEC